MRQDKLKNLTKHLESYKNRLASGLVPERRQGTPEAYWSYIKREIERTSRKIETLVLFVGNKK